MNKRKTYLKIMFNYLWAIAIVLLIIFLTPRLIRFTWPLLVSWIVAMIANPMVRFLERRVKIVRKHGSVLIVILVIAIISGLCYLIISNMAREGVHLAKNLPDIFNNVQREVAEFGNQLQKTFPSMPKGVHGFMNNIGKGLSDYIGDYINKMDVDAIGTASVVAKNVADGLVLFFMMVLGAYFFTAEHDHITQALKRVTSEGLQKKYRMILGNFTTAVGGYLIAQLKIMMVMFLLLFVGMMILGVEYALLLAVLIAIVDFLPILGTGLIIWPWAAYCFMAGNFRMGIGLLIIYLLCQVVRQVIQPKLVADSVGLSPLQTLIFMFIGYRLGGVIGLIVALPIGMIVLNFYHTGLFDNLIKGGKIILHDFEEYRKL